jgi:hypothetical protein
MNRHGLTTFFGFFQKAKKFGYFAFFLVTVFWLTEAVMKYLSEPATTSIQYIHNEHGMQFPLITFCEKEPEFQKILYDECICTLAGNGYCNDESNTKGKIFFYEFHTAYTCEDSYVSLLYFSLYGILITFLKKIT